MNSRAMGREFSMTTTRENWMPLDTENVVKLITARRRQELPDLIANIAERLGHAAPPELPSGHAVAARSHTATSPLSVHKVPGASST